MSPENRFKKIAAARVNIVLATRISGNKIIFFYYYFFFFGLRCYCTLPNAIWGTFFQFNPSHPNPGRREKIKLNSYFSHPLCDHSKGFIKALKAFINKTF